MNPWWTDQQAGLFGGIVGGTIGTLGGLLGTLLGVFGSRGKLRPVVMGIHILLIVLGVIGLVTGIAAVLLHQPYAVWYPPLLMGFILSVVGGCLLPVTIRTYRQAEQRKMQAQDLRRG
jgi:uncharacterized integral membrane protein